MDFYTDICLEYGTIFNNDFKNVPPVSDKALVIVEPRKHKSLRFVINNFVYFCPNWSLYIFHSKENKEYIKNIINNSPNVHCIELFESNITQQIYNDLLLTNAFWNAINSEKILIFQCDTMIRDFGIEKYLDYDYIGAPWITQERIEKVNVIIDIKDKYSENNCHFMNGGLSLRSKSAMLKCLDMLDVQSLKNVIHSLPNEKKSLASDILWEDVFFLHGCKLLNARMPDLITCYHFSSEHIMNTSSLGFHKIWDDNKPHKLSDILNILSIKSLHITPKKANYFIKCNDTHTYSYIQSVISKYLSESFNLVVEIYRVDQFDDELSDLYSKLSLTSTEKTNPEKKIWNVSNNNDILYMIDYFCRFFCWDICY